jgi:hypothetical protein
MLTDEELTTRVRAALRASVPDLSYDGRVPQVHRGPGALAATAAAAAGTALALAPVALQAGDDRAPDAGPSTGTHSSSAGHGERHTLLVAGLHLTYAATAGDLSVLYTGGDGLTLPPDAQKADLGIAAEVWFVDDPADGEPSMYVRGPGSSMIYGVLAPGWTRQQLTDLVEHGSRDVAQSPDGSDD